MIEVSHLQRDALAEVINIGVGRAAASLSQIVRDEVELSAPTVLFLEPDEVDQALDGVEFDLLSVVSQDFSGPFDSRAMLVFPEKNALVIVGHMLGEMVPPEQLSEFEQEAMCEFGNIILNACISSLADLFAVEFEGTLPSYRHADRHTLQLLESSVGERPVVLVVQVDLKIRKQALQGHLIFMMSVTSLTELLDSIDRYLVRQGLL